jgi:hypothetical protein
MAHTGFMVDKHRKLTDLEKAQEIVVFSADRRKWRECRPPSHL